ncbi:F-type H+-transporting ATPase subunit epsilon [Ruminococcaceae bacterium YRB3002]|nr:F-type H+-transporting ATPase subunit epsilon [Ruminococcaceae bacterium YRB3002]
MKTYKLTVSTPNGHVYDGDVVSLSLRGADGDLAVMAGHIPFATVVKAGDCHIETESGEIIRARVDSGILTVGTEVTVLLTGRFETEI